MNNIQLYHDFKTPLEKFTFYIAYNVKEKFNEAKFAAFSGNKAQFTSLRHAFKKAESGDMTYGIDEWAEKLTKEARQLFFPEAILYTEDKALLMLEGSNTPNIALLVDPIDGTRPAAAGFGFACVSVALIELDGINELKTLTLKNIKEGCLVDLNLEFCIWASEEGEFRLTFLKSGNTIDNPSTLPLSKTTSFENMFWEIGLVGRPVKWITNILGELIDSSSASGAFFTINSLSWCFSQVLLGNLDAVVDVGNRIVRDIPEALNDFKKAGKGSVLGLFPYDVAASYVIAKAAGIPLTDAYGKDIADMKLFDTRVENHTSIVIASNKVLHTKLVDFINRKLVSI